MIQKQIQERLKIKKKKKSLKKDHFCPSVCTWETPLQVTYSINEASKVTFLTAK